MFKVPTLLILGAGAGFDIDMCLGATLMKEIAQDVNIAFKGGYDLASGDAKLAYAIRLYAKRQQADANTLYAAGRNIAKGISYAGSIDNYIHNHRSNEAIKAVGKMSIVKVILDYEKRSKVFIDTTKHPNSFRDREGVENSWLYSLFRLAGDGLVVGNTLDTIFDNLAVVTFNYDRCLEQFLWMALQERFLISADHAVALVKKLDILHAYGRVAPLPWESTGGLELGGNQNGEDLDLPTLSQNIRTYNEEINDVLQVDKIHEKLLWGRHIVFLGFHFHSQNVALITPPQGGQKVAVKHAYATLKGRKLAEQDVIESQIAGLLRRSTENPIVHREFGGCGDLFATWGTTLVG